MKSPPRILFRRHSHTAALEALRHPKSCATQIPCGTLPWNPTLAQKTRKNGVPIVRELAGVYCLILGFTAEYSKSVRKFTATYVNPIARMHPCTR